MKTKKSLDFFIEFFGSSPSKPSGSFNLWEKQGETYYNRATLYLNDKYCGCDWAVSERKKSVKYNSKEIEDELESPLKQISPEVAEQLLSMENKNYLEIFEYLESLTNKDGHFAGLKYARKSGGSSK